MDLLPTVRTGAVAAARGLLLAVLSLSLNIVLFVLFLVSFLLIPVLGIGVPLFPVVVHLVRLRAEVERRIAGWSGVDIPSPYRPLPPGLWGRFAAVLRDPATWRDAAWLMPGAIVGGVLGLIAVCVPFYGVEGVLLVPVLITDFVDWYGYGVVWPIDGFFDRLLVLPQGVLILTIGVLGAPLLTMGVARFAALLLAPTAAEALHARVAHLAATRAETVDAQAAELRRIERDLHDGAQAQLVSLSMTIGLAEELLRRDPDAAQRLLAEAREAGGQALAELRRLVRGIHPPVLAERGLPGALSALGLALAIPVSVEVELPGRPEAPVESALYFAAAELLANVVKHSGAASASVLLRWEGDLLRLAVSDDGRGGADPSRGSGLAGIGRRLAAFDGTMVVSSPAGGPTVVTVELPCALSSQRTSPSSGTG
ncbi:histidine kinase [Virgisporangium aliadipatigenens]|uniref:histidine kinase n=1 Tax=Virgisporangium aliadipatigenens TaxID=741659 RepID=A0A8J3YF67_9ACTN|nr:sensor domain-containing protein [Virgisporangium aliadipatigenens]GIJ43143.1 histidine kinase [Virgisporangium aliadipatigenens]